MVKGLIFRALGDIAYQIKQEYLPYVQETLELSYSELTENFVENGAEVVNCITQLFLALSGVSFLLLSARQTNPRRSLQ